MARLLLLPSSYLSCVVRVERILALSRRGLHSDIVVLAAARDRAAPEGFLRRD